MTASRSTSDTASVPSELSDTTRSSRRGLCMTCRHALYCTFLRDGDCPVHQCEEFEVEPDPIMEHLVVPATENAHPDSDNEKRLLGLCSNCDLRDTCKFPMPEGGVWHCEEYE